MHRHPIRIYLVILPLYVMAGLLLFHGPGVYAGTREALSPSQDPGTVEPTEPVVTFPSPIPAAAVESPLSFETLPISQADKPFDAISKDLGEEVVPSQVRDRLNRSIHWICTFHKKESDHMGNGRRLAKARIDERFDVYVCMESVISAAPASMILVIWDRKNRMASSQSRIVRCSRSWIDRGGLPKLNRIDLDLDGRPEIVLFMNQHNGTVYDATDKQIFSINSDLTLRRRLVLITAEWDGRPWNPEHQIDRTLHPVDKNRLVIRTFRTSTEASSPRTEIGRVLLRKKDLQLPYEVAAIQSWDAEDGNEVKDFTRQSQKGGLKGERH